MKNSSIPQSSPLYDAAGIEAVFASIGEGIVVTNEAGKVTRINQYALDIFGYKRSEIVGKRFVDKTVAVYENGKPLHVLDRPIGKAFLTGEVITQKTIYKCKDGSRIPVQLTVSPLILDKKPIGAVQLFRDIRAELGMERMMSDFISLASHQLRTPLSSINIYTGMLLEGFAGKINKQQRTFLETIRGSSYRMNELIDTLLSITRIEAGGITVTPARFEIQALVGEIVSEINPSAKEKLIKLKTDIETVSTFVKTDKLLLKEVLANLLTNAVKYTPEGGEIEINVREDGSDVTFSVSDTGYGIPTRLQKYVFTKFFRADNILSYDVSGTGLGLYLAKMIVDKLNGDLWFDSMENKGTTFYLCVPRHGSLAQKGAYTKSV